MIPKTEAPTWSPMNYRNLDMKLDQFVTYVNDDKINLIPPFQRGHVWKLPTRRKLIANVVQGRPIPAIFLYKEASADKYAYNILDGKQRLESLILFIGNRRSALKINDVNRYFVDPKLKAAANFWVEVRGKKQCLEDLDDDLFRDFQEYVIPTIEISLSEDQPSALDEMINLFVDINSYGVQVKRFDIVKAMSKDALLKSVFKLISLTEKRGKDVLYKSKKNEFTRVLKALQVVENLRDNNSRVDRMWELLVEIVLFSRTKKHRNPVEILRSFIRAKNPGEARVSKIEEASLRKLFSFLVSAYNNKDIRLTRLATNQIHFYTMVTAVIYGDLITKYPVDLIRRLAAFGQILDKQSQTPKNLMRTMTVYRELSEKQTTHVSRREDRQSRFLEAISEL